jgi:hypothetical protein
MKILCFSIFVAFGLSTNAQVLTSDFTLSNVKDTLSYCAPRAIKFISLATLKDGSGNPVTNDSIVLWQWHTSDGATVLSSSNSATLNFKMNGWNTVDLMVETAKGLKSSISKSNYINIRGPQPRFKIVGDSVGDAPFKVKLKRINKNNNSQSHVWYYDYDGTPANLSMANVKTTITGTELDSEITITYTKPGIYFPVLNEKDTFHELSGALLPPCYANWPPTDSTSKKTSPMIVVNHTSGVRYTSLEENTKAWIDAAHGLRIQLSGTHATVNISLIDITGRQIGSGIIQKGMQDFEQKLPQYNGGLIFLQMQTDNEVYTKRLLDIR